MTKDVLLSLKGLQFDGDNQDDITTIQPAQYYKKNGKHYLVYEEEMEDFPGTIKNMIKFQEKELDVTKKGAFNVHLLFQENQKTLAPYASPFGEFMVGIDTKDIRFLEEEEKIQLQVEYDLELNYQHLANCNITLDIRPR